MSPLELTILKILEHSACSEYELIVKLKSSEYEYFEDTSLLNVLDTFQIHFAVYHALFKLDEIGYKRGKFRIYISPLKISLEGINDENRATAVAAPDCQTEVVKLREYYLDLDNLWRTDEQDIEDLLDSFWKRFNKYKTNSITIENAMSVLELKELPSAAELKRAFRRQSFKHHPDLGGDKEKFKALIASYDCLKAQL